MKRRFNLAAFILAAGAFVSAWYLVRFEGTFKANGPLWVTRLDDSGTWYVRPTAVEKDNDEGAIYIVLPASSKVGGLFDAIRVDWKEKTKVATRIPLGPDSGFKTFQEARARGVARIEFHGIAIPQPLFYLMTFPGNRSGPGFHLGRSYTGVVRIVSGAGKDKRTLLTRVVLNSDSVGELGASLSTNSSGRLIAFLWRQSNDWFLYVFSSLINQ